MCYRQNEDSVVTTKIVDLSSPGGHAVYPEVAELTKTFLVLASVQFLVTESLPEIRSSHLC